MKIGVDFGGVIVKASEGESFDSNDGLKIEMKDAIATISSLSKNNEIFIISKASKRVQLFTRDWLSVVGFYKQANFKPENLYFCEKRKDKVAICLSLGIDCFIDDNLEVINSLKGKVSKVIYFNSIKTDKDILSLNEWARIQYELTS